MANVAWDRCFGVGWELETCRSLNKGETWTIMDLSILVVGLWGPTPSIKLADVLLLFRLGRSKIIWGSLVSLYPYCHSLFSRHQRFVE